MYAGNPNSAANENCGRCGNRKLEEGAVPRRVLYRPRHSNGFRQDALLHPNEMAPGNERRYSPVFSRRPKRRCKRISQAVQQIREEIRRRLKRRKRTGMANFLEKVRNPVDFSGEAWHNTGSLDSFLDFAPDGELWKSANNLRGKQPFDVCKISRRRLRRACFVLPCPARCAGQSARFTRQFSRTSRYTR